jgi:hypothetical protein
MLGQGGITGPRQGLMCLSETFVDEKDAFGTLVELGYANAFGKSIFLHLGRSLRGADIKDLWFAQQAADRVTKDSGATSLEGAFDEMLAIWRNSQTAMKLFK